MKRLTWIGILAVLIIGTTACRRVADPQEGGAPATATESQIGEANTGIFDTGAAQKAQEREQQQKTDKKRPKGMEIPAEIKGRPEQLLLRDGYITSYNKDWKIANWVAWRLTKAHTYGDNLRDDMEFHEDTEVPYPRATDDDYYTSKYDRGHLCPSGDNKWDRRAQIQSFLFTNVCPQNHGLNKGDWNDLEMQCRDWARKYGEIYIVTGPVFENGVRNTIGNNKVAVPDALFKVVLCTKTYTRAIGFIVPNEGKHHDLKDYVVPVDEIEKKTGIDFFPNLKDDTEQRVEAADHDDMVKDWNVPAKYYYEGNKSRNNYYRRNYRY